MFFGAVSPNKFHETKPQCYASRPNYVWHIDGYDNHKPLAFPSIAAMIGGLHEEESCGSLLEGQIITEEI